MGGEIAQAGEITHSSNNLCKERGCSMATIAKTTAVETTYRRDESSYPLSPQELQRIMLANWNCFKPPRIDFFYPSQGWLVPVAREPFLLEISVIPCCNRCRGFLPQFRNFLAESTSVSRHWRGVGERGVRSRDYWRRRQQQATPPFHRNALAMDGNARRA